MGQPLDRILSRADDIRAIAARHGASNVRIVGSWSRGEATEGSDLDLLVTLAKERNLLDLIRLKLEVEDLLGLEVDVLEEAAPLHPVVRSEVLKDALPV